MIGAGPRGAGGELSRRHHAAAARPSAPVVLEARGPSRTAAPSATSSLTGAGGRGARRLRLHGLRADRARARAVRQAAAGARASVRIGGKPRQPAQHRRGQRRRHRLRAGEPARDAVRRRAGLQEHLHQHPRAHLAACWLQPARGARDRARAISSALQHPPALRRAARWARCRAATSRRWRWPLAHPPAAACWSWPSRPAAWTSAPRKTWCASCAA